MKARINIVFVFLLLLACQSLSAKKNFNDIVSKAPQQKMLVNDFADMLSDDEEQQLEKKLLLYEDSTSTQIAVVTVDQLNGEDVVDAANQLLINWGVGSKKNNNGFVILVSLSPRKAGIAVGYGLEGVVTDYIADDIYRNELIPGLKTGNYFKAFDDASSALIQAAAGKFKGSPNQNGAGIPVFTIVLLIFIFVVVMAILLSKRRTSYISRRGYYDDTPYNPPFTWWNGGSGWGGGDSGGGGFGGFGGFGGGSSGGGGAGGDW